MGDHIVAGIFFMLVPLVVPLPAMFLGLFMVVAFAYLYFGLYRRLTAAVASDDTPAAAATMAKMRPVMLTNLSLGLIVTAIGIAGPAMFPA